MGRDLEKFAFGLLLIALSYGVEGRIKVISSINDETVYIVRETPIITNILHPSKGMLILSKPVNACGPIDPAPYLPDNSTFSTAHNATETGSKSFLSDFTWVLLVSWSPSDDDCSLRTKAEHAEDAGYSVILLQDPDNDSSEPPFMAPFTSTTPSFEYGWTDASVYACTINPEDWKVLSKNFTNEDFYVTLEDSNSMSGWFTYFILGILVIGAVFFTIGLSYVLVQFLVLILIWIRESIVSRIQQARRDRRRRLPSSQLKKIPIQQWNSDMLQDICSICLESYVTTDRVRILPCSHVFHQVCIDPWLLKQRRKCPNCKRKIVFPDENRDSDSSSDDERTPLLRRGSSARESSSNSTVTSPRASQIHQHRLMEEQIRRISAGTDNYTVHCQQGNNSVGGSRSRQTNQSLTPLTSSINTSSEVPIDGSNDNPSHDIKGRVDQLCARMESVGRKIKRKVKASQPSKLDNDSSSDMSTAVHPVLVSVTVERNQSHIPDTSESTDPHEESHIEPSSSSQTNLGHSISQSAENSEELEVRVVPDCQSASPNHLRNTNEGDSSTSNANDRSISSDLNA